MFVSFLVYPVNKLAAVEHDDTKPMTVVVENSNIIKQSMSSSSFLLQRWN